MFVCLDSAVLNVCFPGGLGARHYPCTHINPYTSIYIPTYLYTYIPIPACPYNIPMHCPSSRRRTRILPNRGSNKKPATEARSAGAAGAWRPQAWRLSRLRSALEAPPSADQYSSCCMPLCGSSESPPISMGRIQPLQTKCGPDQKDILPTIRADRKLTTNYEICDIRVAG